MSYKRIITIREDPIRRNLDDLGETEELAIEIGRGVLGISAESGYDGPLSGPMSRPMPFYREQGVFVPVRSVSVDSLGVFAWTGYRLGLVPSGGPEDLTGIGAVSSLCGWGHVLLPDPVEYLRPFDRLASSSEPPVITSIWTVDQSLSETLPSSDPESWPYRSVGASVLWQMRRQEDVRRDVGAMPRSGPGQWVRKAADITERLFAAFLWRDGHLWRLMDNNLPELMASKHVRARWIAGGDEWDGSTGGDHWLIPSLEDVPGVNNPADF